MEQKRRKEKNRRRREWIYPLITALLFITFCYAGFRLVRDLSSDYRDKKGFEELSAIVAQSAETAPTPTSAPPAGPAGEETDAPAPESGKVPLAKFAQLHDMNSEFFGWLTIEGLGIDYPIMYAPTRSEYYLNRDFYGKYSDSGIPFIDGRCPADGNYYLVYGHLMNNKTVFGRLPQYEDEDCWRENPVFRFDTVFEEREYAVMACFYSRLYMDYEEGFRFYEYFDLSDEDVFNEYLDQVMAAALYDTGVRARYGDELLVLSTCSHYTADGRFVVVAKRIPLAQTAAG
ncbi:MAG: class B sortase [Oscillospiraceae bacterium]|nr:class B sortase [Oscillospiraceae bacterium]